MESVRAEVPAPQEAAMVVEPAAETHKRFQDVAPSPEDEPQISIPTAHPGPVGEELSSPADGGEGPGQVAQVLLPDLARVDQRLAVYAEKLERWEAINLQLRNPDISRQKPPAWDGCFARITDMFRGYSALLEYVLGRGQVPPEVVEGDFDPWTVLYDDINLLEGECEQTFGEGTALVSSWLGNSSARSARRREELIGSYAGAGRYDEAIGVYRDLQRSVKGYSASDETRKMYGLALLKTGQLEEAAAVLSEVLESLPPSAEARSLQRLVADLLLATAHIDEARGLYQRLSDFFESRKGDDLWVAGQLELLNDVDLSAPELPLYMGVLRDYITFDGRNVPEGMSALVGRIEDEYPGSPFLFESRRLLDEVEATAASWLTGRLAEVDRFVSAADYGAAKATLEKLLLEKSSPTVRDSVQQAMDEVVLAEIHDLEKKRKIIEQTLAKQWENALNLFESRQYDGAIAAFRGLFATEYDARAREKAAEASEEAAAEMRQSAARLFVKVRRAGSNQRKRELYRETWLMLHGITVKYPDVSLLEKVKRNLAIIEKKINDFDPALLKELHRQNPEPLTS